MSLSFFTFCRYAPAETEIRHDIKYLAIFSSPALLTADDEKRFSANFQSKYRSRVVLLRPVTAQAPLSLLGTKASLFAVIKINAQREARAIAREIEQALGNGSITALFPLVETPGSQDNFSGAAFYITLEKRSAAFLKLSGQGKLETFKGELDELGRDRNILSFFSGTLLSDTPYQSLHILGFSGLAESQYQTLEGLFHRSVRKLDAADAVLVEKLR